MKKLILCLACLALFGCDDDRQRELDLAKQRDLDSLKKPRVVKDLQPLKKADFGVKQ